MSRYNEPRNSFCLQMSNTKIEYPFEICNFLLGNSLWSIYSKGVM